MGREYPQEIISHLSSLYTTWAGGLLGWPFIDLPWTPFGKAVRAKAQLLAWFQVRGLRSRECVRLGLGHVYMRSLRRLTLCKHRRGTQSLYLTTRLCFVDSNDSIACAVGMMFMAMRCSSDSDLG
jgi:hypothetical protein